MALLIIVISSFLRLFNLGYSNLQGDEIKALFLRPESQSTIEFLLTQRKGPVQFLITGLIKLVDPLYSNELFLRIPYALAGIVSTYILYKMVEILFNKKVAFYASLLFSINGFFIAFSRIAQYQAFVILFGLISLYLLTNINKTWKLYLSAIFWSLSLLAHYDGVFIAPFVLILLYKWYKGSELSKKKKIRVIGIYFSLFFILNALFYIPFIFALTDGTLNYWQGRISTQGTKISSSQYLFSLYNPKGGLYIYLILSLIGIYYSIRKPSLISIGLFVWFLFPFLFMEAFVKIPGTHIYTYLLPVVIIMSLGIVNIGTQLSRLKIKYLNLIYEIVVALVLCFYTLMSFFVFADNRYEYPWEDEYIGKIHLSKPLQYYHLSLFGFPYNRNWDEIGQYLFTYNKDIPYTSNERSSITSYYIKNKRDGNRAGFYVEISRKSREKKNPHNFSLKQ